MKNEDFKKLCRKKVMPLRLQFFAEGEGSEDGNSGGSSNKSEGDKGGKDKGRSDNKEGEDKEEKEKEFKRQGVSEYLKTLGVDSEEDLTEIVEKHKKEEEENKTDLQKAQTELSKTIKLLNETRKERDKAVAQLEALKMGAKIDLVEDLVIVAMSKVTKDKDVKKAIAEIKKGNSGAVYFESSENSSGGRRTTSTAGRTGQNTGKKDDDAGSGSNAGKGIASRLLEGRQKKTKSSFFDD